LVLLATEAELMAGFDFEGIIEDLANQKSRWKPVGHTQDL
jgi:hypothetical protein